MILVAHALSIIDFMCSKVAVMYLGKFIDFVNRDDIFQSIEELDTDLTEHIQFVIDALIEKADELGLAG